MDQLKRTMVHVAYVKQESNNSNVNEFARSPSDQIARVPCMASHALWT